MPKPRPTSHSKSIPSIRSTMAFLKLCDVRFGSQRAALNLINAGRKAGAPGLPDRDYWPRWTAPEMNAAVAYLKSLDA